MDNEERMEIYWDEIPIGRENAWNYDEICRQWGMSSRQVRNILHWLSYYDNGDDLILIRSSNGAGFYRTNDKDEIKAYRKECLNRGKNTFAPLRKIDRVLSSESGQLSIYNNMRAVRVSVGMSASDVCKAMQLFHPGFDMPMLSKMENGKCWPTPLQLAHLASIYKCTPHDLIDMEMYNAAI